MRGIAEGFEIAGGGLDMCPPGFVVWAGCVGGSPFGVDEMGIWEWRGMVVERRGYRFDRCGWERMSTAT